MSTAVVTRRPFIRARRNTYGGGFTASQAAQVKKLILQSEELKYLSAVTNIAIAINSMAFIDASTFNVTQGTGAQQRVADSLTWAGSIDLRLEMINGVGANSKASYTIRFMIFQWFANQVPVPADVLLAGPSGNQDIASQYNHDHRKEFVVLFDKCFTTVGNTTSASNPATSAFTTGVLNFRIPLTKARKTVQFAGGGITGTNRLYILYVSDAVPTEPDPTLTYSVKAVYRDG